MRVSHPGQSKWSPRGRRIIIQNVPSILPPGIPFPSLQAVLLRAQLEDIQYQLANLQSEASTVLNYMERQSPSSKIDNPAARARDYLFDQRRSLINSIDRLYPVIRIPASMRIGYSKCTRKLYLPSSKSIGLIIGPRGVWLKQLEAELHVQISIRGQGSTPDSRGSTEVFQAHDSSEPLHALIEGETEQSLDECVKRLEQIIAPIPDQENERKKAQLRQLALLNGVVSADSAFSTQSESSKDKPPWFDETLALQETSELNSAVQQLYSDISATTNEASQQTPLRDPRFQVDLKEFDLSFVVPEPQPPGSEV